MLVDRATAADFMAWAAAWRAHGSPLPGRLYKWLLAQVVVSEAYALRETADAAPLVIGGCFDLAPGAAGEVFFLEPNGGLGRRLVRVHRLASRWLDEAAVTRPQGLVAYVRAGNRNGERLARALGFAPTGAALGGIREWKRWARSPRP
jgi:hypothetical protein